VSADYETVASFPDIASAQLVREVLVEGGLEEVEVHTVSVMNYMPRAHALDYEIRVPLADVARAQLLLRDYQEEAELAATTQSGAHGDEALTKPRSRWILYIAALALLLLLIGPVFMAGAVIAHFVRSLFGM